MGEAGVLVPAAAVSAHATMMMPALALAFAREAPGAAAKTLGSS